MKFLWLYVQKIVDNHITAQVLYFLVYILLWELSHINKIIYPLETTRVKKKR